MNVKKIICGVFGAVLILTAAGCGGTQAVKVPPAESTGSTEKSPKYVFLFIGDGMSYPQFQTASDYLGALADKDYVKALPSNSYVERGGAVLDGPKSLNFMDFEVAGSAVTYDLCSFAPDSASTATSIAAGYKTYSGMINVDITGSTAYETIAEKLHKQKGWKVGIISSVNINHATPAAFYAHQASRNDYYEIGEELVKSGFEYFAGGGLKNVTGPSKDKTSLYKLAEEAGYKVTYTQADAEAVTSADKKVILIDEHLADSDAMDYEMDRQKGEWALADYVKKGIEVLDNDTGFFMMCEGGKIDWACHANDAGTTVTDTLALADAVQVAIDFAKERADETLILVTGDHETGGMTIGFAGTDYDTYLDSLANQIISYVQFDKQYVNSYKKNGTSFEDAMNDVEKLFGLKLSGGKDDRLLLTDYEVQRLRTAYELAMSDASSKGYTQEQYVLYGTYNPFSVTVTHILNNKSGVDFTSYSHTGLPVAVFADGAGADAFTGYYDNTEIYKKMASLLEVK
ncbi:MAG: alkaline phosphatase [Synergistes jonesii]|uniref:alkaline phosphatase n=1 Tax=Synergistes jonesii TaxID=2754 RepID=UPI002A74C2E7|nr:alkaline phosphatase [Synergistes jonesii]MDY2984490.1 alkaline phosphatase [Synergistes jonesii]